MFSRGGTQFIVFFVLSLIGVWIIYNDLISPSAGDIALYDGTIAAMYWFAFLLYMLLCIILGFPFRRHSWKWLLLVHVLSATIAVAGTVTLVNLGQQYAASEAQQEELDLDQGTANKQD